MSASASTSHTSSDSQVPLFPADKDKFDEWKLKMESYLAARSLLSTILRPSASVQQTKKMTDTDYIKWLDDCESRCEIAEMKQNTASGETLSNIHKDPDVIFFKELTKCRRAVSILINSFTSRQLSIISNIFPCNAHEVWRVVCSSYGVCKSADTINSLLDTLTDIRKHDTESMREFISRVDNIIDKLKSLDSSISEKMRTHYLIRGLRHIDTYKLTIEIIMNLDREGKMNSNDVEQQLISRENTLNTDNQRMKSNTTTPTTTTSTSSSVSSLTDKAFMSHSNNFRGRGGYRGRGNFQRFNNNNNNRQNNNENNDDDDDINEHVKCNNCNGMGHYANTCSSKKRRRDAAHATSDTKEEDKETASVASETEYSL